MSKAPWIAALVGVGAVALAVRSDRTGSRAQAVSDACGHCGTPLGKANGDRVYGSGEHARGTKQYPFCSYRCVTANEAKRAVERSKLSLVWRNQYGVGTR